MLLAWLNLDLEIATCLYDGMDKYSETWLEFVFPAYLLSIIIALYYSTGNSQHLPTESVERML